MIGLKKLLIKILEMLNHLYIKQPYLSCYYSSSGDATFTDIVKWNTIIEDTHNGYSTSTGKYTCPMEGKYLAIVNIYSNTLGGSGRPRIFHNGANIDTVQLNSENCQSISAILLCNAGDTIYYGPQNSSYPIHMYGAAHHNLFTILRIGDK